MTCRICNQPCCKPIEGPPQHIYIKESYDTIGHWAKPLGDCDLCWYHQKKVDGHFDRSDEYFRFNRGPHEWTPYKSFYPPGSQYL
jgi:hypothetical protein